MLLRTKTSYVFSICFLFSLYSFVVVAETTDKIQFRNDNLVMDLGGKCVQENYFSNNLNLLNAGIFADTTFMMRSTMDYFLSMNYDERILFYNAMRFRFRWGTNTDTRSGDSSVKLVDTTYTVPGTTTNKHLLWMRESWLKIQVGGFEDLNNFIQIGLIPYQVGRGISLGAAYDVRGFVTFIPGSAIDQYAPGVLFSFNPIQDRLITDCYVGLTKNDQLTLSANIENIRNNEIGACPQRGIGRQSFLAVVRADVRAYKQDHHKVDVEPYLIFKADPDTKVEFANDANVGLSTAGCAIEGVYQRFNWGIEGAYNFGDLDIRPWDRNYTTLSKDANGNVIEQYTKIYTQDPATTVNPSQAPVATTVTTLLNSIPQEVYYNGKQLGTVDINGVLTNIYQAFNRIRPAQKRLFRGFFATGDATYIFWQNELEVSLGAGYASGHLDPQKDQNFVGPDELLSEPFNGFVPIQSVYSGKRLRHFIAFAQGLPRFNVQYPSLDTSKINIVGLQGPGVINQFTNIVFIGGRVELRPHDYADHALSLAPNIIAYWTPEAAEFKAPNTDFFKVADNYLGLELNLEFSMYFYKNLKLSGYLGAFIPGQHYKDMCGTIVQSYNLPTGADAGYAGNINLAYVF